MAYDGFDVTADGRVEIWTEYDDESAVIEVLAQVLAVLENTEITDIEPLYESVEPEAVFRLLQHAAERDCRVGVEFTYDEFTVTVSGCGCIHVHDGSPRLIHSQEGYGR
ncbi:HalOD1 output domain-containing protein [Natrinema halophilum]|uniref:Halobacterial output domain-containing protein n=1 Tax=Natrinema halophilum TaxID=1699371 RepID=A0A7D5H2R7_9EURY|nr:HalOD1 output domain-containing protein [Natrinema halophilum]QLG49251.1 hypothetical protein HYG82_10470 [Natrinema halophilum]